MSLNGLDKSIINDAYQAALAEAGGWLLLKYVSRDEVELLQRGSGGVIEMRDAVSQCTEPSPLYGFIQYRRRKIVLKYIPENTSRLLQARVSVHFQAVCEKFAPHDAELSITSAAELKETALSAACSLHTASASTSSSNSSIRRRKLAEISEDTEVISVATGNNGVRASKGSEEFKRLPDQQDTVTYTPRKSGEKETLQQQRQQVPSTAGSVPNEAAASSKIQGVERSNTAATVPLIRTRNDTEYDLMPSDDRRQSSQSSRPALRNLYENGSYRSKPKVKLGPRPSLDTDRRPRTSGSFFRQSESRPIATLPAGIRPAPRRAAPKSPNSTHFQATTITHPQVPRPSFDLVKAPMRPVVRLSSVMSPPSPSQSTNLKSSAITPEKQRLMKALELRKKQMTRIAQESTSDPQKAAIPLKSCHGDLSLSPLSKGLADGVVMQNDSTDAASKVEPTPIAKDLGITQSDSSPASLTDSIEAASTTASSFSDMKACEQTEKFLDSSTIYNALASPIKADIIVTEQNLGGSEINDVGPPKDEPQATEDRPERLAAPEDPPTVSHLQPMPEHGCVVKDEPSIAVANDSIDQAESPQSQPQSFSELGSTERNNHNEAPDVRNHFMAPRVSKRPHTTQLPPVYTSAEESDENFLSDDSLMEELNLAIVQEAKPISVSKSPITPVFQIPGEHRRSDIPRTPGNFRNVSSPVGYSSGRENQASSSRMRASEIPRSVSAAQSNITDSQGAQTAVAKKVNVSSGISKRIKALELLSSREASPVTPSLPSSSQSNTSSSLAGFRQSSLRSLDARSASASPQPDSISQRIPSPTPSSPPSPESMKNKVYFRSPSRADSPHNRIRTLETRSPEPSTKVTRTIWDPRHRDRSYGAAAKGNGSPDLHQSSSSVDTRSLEGQAEGNRTILPTDGTSSSSPTVLLSGPSSIHSVNTDRQSSFERSRSEPITLSPTQDLASNGQQIPDERKEEKKESRASRLFRRMSSMSTVSRRSLVQAMSPTSKEANPLNYDASLSSQAHSQDHSQMPCQPRKIDVGDVNIQFPDTLLWKRRCMVIDEQGYMVLSPPKSDQSLRSVTKRYHFSDFQPPFVPDQDRQELANSVILDFRDGSTLQCAAENLTGQAYIFKVLHESHRAWTANEQ